MAIMVDQGRIDYKEPVSTYWPEFSQNGKENITIQDVLRHEAGLYKLHESIRPEWTHAENIKKNKIGKIIESDRPQHLKEKRVYHAVTKDWITNEIFRRVESQGRTMGEYWRQEIMPQIGEDVYLSLSRKEIKLRCKDYRQVSPYLQYKNSLMNEEDRFTTFHPGQPLEILQLAQKIWGIDKLA